MQTLLTHSYRQEDAQAILRRALRESAPDTGTFSHEELRQMAAELDISADALDRAARAWDVEQREQQEQREFVAGWRREFLAHLAPYLAVNTMLVIINLVTGAGHFWALWPILGWGIGILSHGGYALRTRGEAFEKEFQQWCEARQSGNRPAMPPSEAAA